MSDEAGPIGQKSKALTSSLAENNLENVLEKI